MNKSRDNPARRLLIVACSILIFLGIVGMAASLFSPGGGSSGGSSGTGNVEIVENKVLVGVGREQGLYALDEKTERYDWDFTPDYIKGQNFSEGGSLSCNMVSDGIDDEKDVYLSYNKNSTENLAGSVVLTNTSDNKGDIFVIETDFMWLGCARYNSEPQTNTWFVKLAFGSSDITTNVDKYADGFIYIRGDVGSNYYSISSMQSKYTNDYVLICDQWYNLRIEMNTSDHSYTIYINNQKIESGIFNSSYDATTLDKFVLNIRPYAHEACLKIDNTYINAISQEN